MSTLVFPWRLLLAFSSCSLVEMVAGRILGVGGLRVGSFMPQEREMVGLWRGCYWKPFTFMPRCLRVGASRKRYQDMPNYHLL